MNATTTGFGIHAQVQHQVENTEHMDLPEDFCVEDFLGSGAYGTVCSVRIKATNDVVAIKKCKKIFTSKTLAKRTLREMKLLRIMNHPNIVHLRAIIAPSHRLSFDEVYLIFEQLDTDLAQIIRSPQRLNIDHIQYFMCQLLSALEYLHDGHIIHRDLKPRNILINSDCTLKIADFGLARWFQDGLDQTTHAITDYVTTRWYRAPEILAGWSTYGSKVDMWAVGCILAELFLRSPIFPGQDSRKQLEYICGILGRPEEPIIRRCPKTSKRHLMRTFDSNGDRSLAEYFPTAPARAIELIGRLLDFDPEKRPSATDCMHHPFVASYGILINDHKLNVSASSFSYEKQKLSVDILRQEILFEIDDMVRCCQESAINNNVEAPVVDVVGTAVLLGGDDDECSDQTHIVENFPTTIVPTTHSGTASMYDEYVIGATAANTFDGRQVSTSNVVVESIVSSSSTPPSPITETQISSAPNASGHHSRYNSSLGKIILTAPGDDNDDENTIQLGKSMISASQALLLQEKEVSQTINIPEVASSSVLCSTLPTTIVNKDRNSSRETIVDVYECPGIANINICNSMDLLDDYSKKDVLDQLVAADTIQPRDSLSSSSCQIGSIADDVISIKSTKQSTDRNLHSSLFACVFCTADQDNGRDNLQMTKDINAHTIMKKSPSSMSTGSNRLNSSVNVSSGQGNTTATTSSKSNRRKSPNDACVIS